MERLSKVQFTKEFKEEAVKMVRESGLSLKEVSRRLSLPESTLRYFDRSDARRGGEDLETVVKQVIDQALVTEPVVDIFDAAGIKKPDISILSEEFLMEVRNMQHKHVAMETLRKLLNDEIKARSKTNLVQSNTLMEMLENSIKRYQNKVITAAEVVEELIELAKTIKEMDKIPEEMKLSNYEYAFYTAIADNESARELMQKDTLRELAIVLYEQVKKNAFIDWTIKESDRAKLRVVVKRTLRKYGYPPDMQELATETVIQQAEMIADELLQNV